MTPQANIAFWFELLRRMTAKTCIDPDHDPRFDKDLQPPLATLSLQKGMGTWVGRTGSYTDMNVDVRIKPSNWETRFSNTPHGSDPAC